MTVLASGCKSSAGRHAVEYPQSWPIPQLTAPPDSHRAELPMVFRGTASPYVKDGCIVNPGLQGSGRGWALAFNSSISWSELNAWVDQQLKPAGYMLSWRDRESPEIGAIQTYYVDRACTQFIQITSFDGVYVYQVTIYDHPQDQRIPAFARMQPIP